MQTSSVFAPVVLEVTDTAFGVPRGTPTDDRYSHRYRLGPVHEEKTGSETLCEGGGDVERGVSMIPAPSFFLRVFNDTQTPSRWPASMANGRNSNLSLA